MPRLLPRLLLHAFTAAAIAADAGVPPPGPQPTGAGTAAACFAPGTPEDYIAEVEARLAGLEPGLSLAPPAQGFVFSDNMRWSSTATNPGPLRQGDPTTIRWSIVPDGTSIFGYGGEPTAPSNLRATLNSIYGSEANWLPIFEQVFENWAAVTGLSYVYEPNDDGSAFQQSGIAGGQINVRGDVRISGHLIDNTNGILAYNFFPQGGDMVIDTSDNNFRNTANDSLILRNTLAHEHGHGLGLQHVCPRNSTKLMEPILATTFRGPQFDDILGGNRGYGDEREGNDTAIFATNLGTVSSGSRFDFPGLSIDDNSDVDFFRFQVSAGVSLSATATPRGSTYLSGTQVGNCDTGQSFDALRVHDLGLEVVDRDRTTVLASSTTNPAGVAEAVSGVSLPNGAGTYYLRVFATTTTNSAQMYDLSLSIDAASGPTLYEAAQRSDLDLAGTWGSPVATATGAPFSFAPTSQPSPVLFYRLDDGTGSPPLMQLTRVPSDITFWY